MEILKRTGIILVMISLALMSALLFTGKYRLADEAIAESNMSGTQRDAFRESVRGLSGETLASKFRFISRLNDAFDKANRQITESHSVSEDEIDQLARLFRQQSPIGYSTDSAAKVFPGSDPVAKAKRKGVGDYSSWLGEREFEDYENFKSQLAQSIDNYNKDVADQLGFRSNRIRSLTFYFVRTSYSGWITRFPALMLILTIGLLTAGTLMYTLPRFNEGEAGIKNDDTFRNSLTSIGWSGIIAGILLILFYCVLYWFPHWIAEWTLLLDPVSRWMSGRPADHWFFYGFFYSWAILFLGLKFLTKYRHSRLQQIRTWSVIFFQLLFAFALPHILFTLNLPEVDLKNIWPLDYTFFFEWRIDQYMEAGALGIFFFGWGVALIVIGVPVITYFFGKRWYCSWVCGCGGLAETAGDPFRHLSDKGLRAWRIERILVHSVLLFAVVMTGWVLYTFFSGKSVWLGISSYKVREVYGFLIGAVFAGVIGVGFYPFMGSRVWCRFGCPLAAYLGIVQRFKSRFRITANGGQCMSCGNCSTYCEMGIDVRAYAQKGQNIIRASCVGCGICAAVCPRGVLRLENKKEKGRFNTPVLLGNDGYISNRK